MCGPKVSARDYYGHRVTELNAKLAPKLKEKLAAAATVEAIKSEELRQLHNSQVLQNAKTYYSLLQPDQCKNKCTVSACCVRVYSCVFCSHAMLQ
jgi:hypothetical protein